MSGRYYIKYVVYARSLSEKYGIRLEDFENFGTPEDFVRLRAAKLGVSEELYKIRIEPK